MEKFHELAGELATAKWKTTRESLRGAIARDDSIFSASNKE
jgi:hypothetical protein